MYQRRMNCGGMKANEIYGRVAVLYGSNLMIQRRFTKWVERIRGR
jgi:hypothetical protein